MSHQSKGNTANVTSFSLQTDAHHNKPEEHEETKEKFDEDISLEEALSTL
tara:strand:+ start:375 stop:524 length:150 start_codon:yes stop_codon:yes gene_type:complete